MSVHVLVGGVGFVGANLAVELVERGYSVVVASRRGSVERRPGLARFLEGLGVRIVVARSLWGLDMGGLGDVYYYLPGALTGGYRAMLEAHVKLLEKTISDVAETGAGLVYVSSIAALGVGREWRRGCTVYEEERHLAGDRVYPSIHMETKAMGERLLVEKGGALGWWSIVRPGVVFGPWGGHLEWRLLYMASRLRVGPRLGRGVPHIYSQDLARILADAGEGRHRGAWVNAVDPLHPDLADLFRALCRGLGHSRCATIPVWPLVSLAGRASGRGSPLRLIYSILAHGCRYDSRRLEGFQWTPLEEQARGFIEWARRWL